jgi:hypothetical protein
MKNKEKALELIERINSAIANVKSSANRGAVSELEDKFERLQFLVEDLQSLISIQEDNLLTRPYRGI